MKKLSIIVPEKDAEEFVRELRDAGVLHVKHVSTPESRNTREVENRLNKLERLISLLEPFSEGQTEKGSFPQEESKFTELAEALTEKASALEELKQQAKKIKLQLEELRKWQNVSGKDIELLKEKGLFVELARAHKREFKKIASQKGVYRAGESAGQVYFALIAEKSPELGIQLDSVEPPDESEAELLKKKSSVDKKIEKIEKEFRRKAKLIESAKAFREDLRKKLEFHRVAAGMKKEKSIAYVQGWCPEKSMGRIKRLAKRQGAGYLAEDPEDPDEVPTHITNPAWIRIIKPVFDFMNTVPGYAEFDISFLFLIFFSLFFAMLIGDAGYGAVFLAGTFLAHRKFRSANRDIFFLIYVLSGATVVWGALTGTWFGSEYIASLPVVRHITVDALGSFAEEAQNNVIFLCFVIGAIQLTTAHLMRAVKMANSPKALAELGWCGIIWGMFGAAGTFVLGKNFPQISGWLLASGTLLVLVFQNFRANVVKGMLSTLAELPLSIVSSFSDVVSYLRLFAVGYATVVLASTFNQMALEIGRGGLIADLGAGFILLAGHLLNILLAIMAVVVHGIRLNMLEFSSHLGMQWSGTKYKPFSK